MDNPMIQVRDFGDGTWSVMARVWNPQKLLTQKFQNICNLILSVDKR